MPVWKGVVLQRLVDATTRAFEHWRPLIPHTMPLRLHQTLHALCVGREQHQARIEARRVYELCALNGGDELAGVLPKPMDA